MKDRISDSLLKAAQGTSEPLEIYDTVEAGFVARVRPSGHTSFWMYRHRGRQKIKLAEWPRRGAKDARELFRAERTRLENGTSVEVTPTLSEFIDRSYVPAYTVDHKSLKHLDNLKPFRAAWGNYALDEITEELVERWRATKRRAGASASTVNRNVAALKAALSFAVQKKVMSEHPLRGLRRLRIEQEHRVRWLAEEEEQRLREKLVERETDMRLKRASANAWRERRGYTLLPAIVEGAYADHLRPMVILSLNTGLRQGELFSLSWNRATDEFITVNATNSKSRRSRHIPLNAEARACLETWRGQTDGEGFVFKGKGERFDNVRKAWGRVLVDAGIMEFTWHDMRHHFASRLVMNGVALNTVRELLGHADLQTTLRYAHLAPKHLKEAVAVLDRE